jgi:hypothetical protein
MNNYTFWHYDADIMVEVYAIDRIEAEYQLFDKLYEMRDAGAVVPDWLEFELVWSSLEKLETNGKTK